MKPSWIEAFEDLQQQTLRERRIAEMARHRPREPGQPYTVAAMRRKKDASSFGAPIPTPIVYFGNY